MRKLLLTRGACGCGKSTFLREQGLEAYTLQPDTLRLAFGGPMYDASGHLQISQSNDRAVWKLLLDLLEKRMRQGELVVVDATHANPRSFRNYYDLARKYRYQTVVIDFSDVALETCLARNEGRESYKYVPPREMRRIFDMLQNSRVPDWAKVIKPEEVQDFLTIEPTDASQYKQIHHIGDIQGCYDPLIKYFDIYGIKDDELYIFTGDLLDRGPQNAQVLEWALENYQRPNFIFIEGNHDVHLRTWTSGGAVRSREFTLRTQPQLEAAGISTKKVHGLLYKMREMFYYRFHDKTVLVSHGGLSTLPTQLALVSSQQFIKGAGLYEEVDQSDATFDQTTDANTYQVHGHRNPLDTPMFASQRCFNLEGKVEFGGHLRAVSLGPDGFYDRSIDSQIDATHDIVENVGTLRAENGDSVADLIASMRASKDIYEKPQPDSHISSFNFKRDVFFNQRWNDLNVHARGLFINTEREVIVARAYEKFFNIGERPETHIDKLAGAFRYPAKVWIKENGYLGMVGFDPESTELIFASKSSTTSDFASWLKQQFDTLVTDEKARGDIRRYLADGGKTLVFEVIEPVNDPHIVTYAGAKLVLLDIVYNKPAFQVVGDDKRQQIADQIGCAVKQQAASFANGDELHTWLKAVNDFHYKEGDAHIEGFVLQDSKDYMVKVKLPWYGFWRQMRTQLERLQQGKKAQLAALDINNALGQEFLDFLTQKEQSALQDKSIVELRREFERQV